MSRLSFIAYALLVLLVVLSAGCTNLPKRVVNRTLTPEEMAIPPGRYQAGIDMRHTCQVDYDPPTAEFLLRRKMQYGTGPFSDELGTTFFQVYTDSGCGIIYTRSENDTTAVFPNQVGRMDSDGTEDWILTIVPPGTEFESPDYSAPDGTEIKHHTEVGTLEMVCITQGAVIVFAIYNKTDSEYTTGDVASMHNRQSFYCFLECISLDGSIVWRSNPSRWSSTGTLYFPAAWRISEDKILMSTSTNIFGIYSIANGELLETFDMPYITDAIHQPVLLDNGSLIIWAYEIVENEPENSFLGNRGRNFIMEIKPDRSLGWYQELQYGNPTLAVISASGTILCPQYMGIKAYSSSTGAVIWQKYHGMMAPYGSTPEGNFLVSSREDYESTPFLQMLSPTGEEIWDAPVITESDRDAIIIYRDGSILVGQEQGLSLISPDGTISWTVDENELGIATTKGLRAWSLNPTEDGRLVATIHNLDDWSSWLLTFAPPD